MEAAALEQNENVLMLDLYVLDYLRKRNYEQSARSFMSEARISDKVPALDIPNSFLYEWWVVFWESYSLRCQDAAHNHPEALKPRMASREEMQHRLSQRLLTHRRPGYPNPFPQSSPKDSMSYMPVYSSETQHLRGRPMTSMEPMSVTTAHQQGSVRRPPEPHPTNPMYIRPGAPSRGPDSRDPSLMHPSATSQPPLSSATTGNPMMMTDDGRGSTMEAPFPRDEREMGGPLSPSSRRPALHPQSQGMYMGEVMGPRGSIVHAGPYNRGPQNPHHLMAAGRRPQARMVPAGHDPRYVQNGVAGAYRMSPRPAGYPQVRRVSNGGVSWEGRGPLGPMMSEPLPGNGALLGPTSSVPQPHSLPPSGVMAPSASEGSTVMLSSPSGPHSGVNLQSQPEGAFPMSEGMARMPLSDGRFMMSLGKRKSPGDVSGSVASHQGHGQASRPASSPAPDARVGMAGPGEVMKERPTTAPTESHQADGGAAPAGAAGSMAGEGGDKDGEAPRPGLLVSFLSADFDHLVAPGGLYHDEFLDSTDFDPNLLGEGGADDTLLAMGLVSQQSLDALQDIPMTSAGEA